MDAVCQRQAVLVRIFPAHDHQSPVSETKGQGPVAAAGFGISRTPDIPRRGDPAESLAGGQTEQNDFRPRVFLSTSTDRLRPQACPGSEYRTFADSIPADRVKGYLQQLDEAARVSSYALGWR